MPAYRAWLFQWVLSPRAIMMSMPTCIRASVSKAPARPKILTKGNRRMRHRNCAQHAGVEVEIGVLRGLHHDRDEIADQEDDHDHGVGRDQIAVSGISRAVNRRQQRSRPGRQSRSKRHTGDRSTSGRSPAYSSARPGKPRSPYARLAGMGTMLCITNNGILMINTNCWAARSTPTSVRPNRLPTETLTKPSRTQLMSVEPSSQREKDQCRWATSLIVSQSNSNRFINHQPDEAADQRRRGHRVEHARQVRVRGKNDKEHQESRDLGAEPRQIQEETDRACVHANRNIVAEYP